MLKRALLAAASLCALAAGARADQFGPSMALGANTSVGGTSISTLLAERLSTSGGTLSGVTNLALSPTITPYTGAYATDCSADWHLGASDLALAPDMLVSAPSVIGTHSISTTGGATVSGDTVTATSGPGFTTPTSVGCAVTLGSGSAAAGYAVQAVNSPTVLTLYPGQNPPAGATTYTYATTQPDQAGASRAMLLLNASAGPTHPNYGLTPLTINFDDSPNLTLLSNPGTQDAGIQLNVLANPTGGTGNCGNGTETCIDIWTFNPDLLVRGFQGQVALGIVMEGDYNNLYAGKDAIQINLWLAYGGGYPVLASIYSTNQFTDNYTATATISGATVTVTNGSGFDPDLTYMLTVNGQLIRVVSVTPCANQVGHQACSTSLTLQQAPAAQGTGVAISWSPAGATYGILFSDDPTHPLNQIADMVANTMAYYGVVLGGHHYVDFSSINEATDGTGAPYFGTMNSGQKLCFSGFDACRNQYMTGAADVLQDVSNNGIVFDEVAAPNGVNHVRVTNGATGGGAIISAVGTDTNVDLDLSAQGTGRITLGSPLFVGQATLTSTASATSATTGALQTNGGVGVGGDSFFGGGLTVPNLPTSAGTAKGTWCSDVNGVAYLKTTPGACI